MSENWNTTSLENQNNSNLCSNMDLTTNAINTNPLICQENLEIPQQASTNTLVEGTAYSTNNETNTTSAMEHVQKDINNRQNENDAINQEESDIEEVIEHDEVIEEVDEHNGEDEEVLEQGDEDQTMDALTCFICSKNIEDNEYSGIRSAMNHSHAPALALLTDVLGYKLEDAKLHSEVMCKSCFKLLDIVDELQQTLTDSKTDIRTKFLETVSLFKLRYRRTDKMLKPRCIKCVQAEKKARPVRAATRKRPRKNAKPVKTVVLDSVEYIDDFPEFEDIEDDDDYEEKPKKRKKRGPKPKKHKKEKKVSTENGDSAAPKKTRRTRKEKPPPPEPKPKTVEIIYDNDPAMFSPTERLKVGQQKLDNPELSQMFSCFYCTRVFDAPLNLKMHSRVHHMPLLIYDSSPARYRMGIKIQNNQDAEPPYNERCHACLFCDSVYKLQNSLQNHFREHHSPIKPYICQECKEGFRKPIELSRHRLYRCPAKPEKELSVPN